MSTILTKLALFLLLPIASYTQSLIPKSQSYQEMFPNNVDEKKLLVILPPTMTMAQIDSLLPDLSDSELASAYKSHVMKTERTLSDVQKYIKEYQINCEVIKQDDYKLQSFPSDSYPLVVYPEIVTVNNFHVSHAYRMKDVANNIKYGYARNTEATYTGSYFEQLNDYTNTLRANKKGQTNNTSLSEKIEEDVAKKQKKKNRLRGIGIGVLLSVLTGVTILARQH